jgi:hypothetical protein
MEKKYPCTPKGAKPCGEEKEDPGLDGVDNREKSEGNRDFLSEKWSRI